MPADLTGEALEDLKAWLGISRSAEDPLLTDLLGASLSLCEAFTGQTPIEQTIEERLEPKAGEHRLRSLPVRALISAERIAQDGLRYELLQSDFDFRIDACAQAVFDLKKDQTGQSISVSIRAGLAPQWGSTPHALKQGIIRLAAYHYRDRDARGASAPPASVSALWRPWRTLRLA